MSYGIDRAGWTDDEIAAGVHIAVALGRWPGEDFEDENVGYGARPFSAADEVRASEWQALFDESGAELLVILLSTTSEVRMRLSQYILEVEKEQIVDRYSNRERLPAEFKAAALRSDAVPILIKSFLAKVLGVYPAPQVNNEILELSSATSRNGERRPAYDRVGDIQKYLHRKADEARGPGAHLDLPGKVMRHLLSSSRLHISLHDMFGSSTAYWETIWDAEMAASMREAATPRAGFIPVDKRRIRQWRVPQLKPLTHYATRRARSILRALSNISLELPLDEYRLFALAALNGKEPSFVDRYIRLPRTRAGMPGAPDDIPLQDRIPD